MSASRIGSNVGSGTSLLRRVLRDARLRSVRRKVRAVIFDMCGVTVPSVGPVMKGKARFYPAFSSDFACDRLSKIDVRFSVVSFVQKRLSWT